MTSFRLPSVVFRILAAILLAVLAQRPAVAQEPASPAEPQAQAISLESLTKSIHDLQVQLDKLKLQQIKLLQQSKKPLTEEETELLATSTAPSGSAPSNSVPPLTSVAYTDITCRPKLDVGATWTPKPPPIGGPQPFNPYYKESDSAGEVLPKRGDCQPLAPLTRLFLENSAFVASGGYSNSVGFANALLPSNPLITTATDSYFLGVGYSKKPILKQLRGLFFPADSREAIYDQGTWKEDFFWNAITMDASYSWGRQLQVKNQVPSDSFNSRPFYSVTGTYTLDLEKVWIYATHGFSSDTRPADQGWYFGPKSSDYFK